MWVTTPATLVWLLVPDSVPECGAVERALGWASDNLGFFFCSASKQLCGLRRVTSCLWVQMISYEGTEPLPFFGLPEATAHYCHPPVIKVRGLTSTHQRLLRRPMLLVMKESH